MLRCNNVRRTVSRDRDYPTRVPLVRSEEAWSRRTSSCSSRNSPSDRAPVHEFNQYLCLRACGNRGISNLHHEKGDQEDQTGYSRPPAPLPSSATPPAKRIPRSDAPCVVALFKGSVAKPNPASEVRQLINQSGKARIQMGSYRAQLMIPGEDTCPRERKRFMQGWKAMLEEDEEDSDDSFSVALGLLLD